MRRQERGTIPGGSVSGGRNLGATDSLFPMVCAEVPGERGTIPGGHVSGVRNQGPLDTFGKMKLDSEAKAVTTLVSIPDQERGPGFHPIPGIGLAVRCLFLARI